MSTPSKCAWMVLPSLALLFPAWVAAAPSAPAARCSAPPPLEARSRTHPDVEAYTALGNWFGENHKMACAVETFRAAVKLWPDSPSLNYLLGLSLFTAGRPEEAIEPLRKSAQVSPNEDRTHLLLGAALTSLGRAAEAFGEWQAAFKIDPNSKMALDGMAKFLIAGGDYETVIHHLEPIQRDESLSLDLGIAYGKSGLYEDAARVLVDGLKTYPDSDKLTQALVTIYVNQLRYQDASRTAALLAHRDPRDIEAQKIYLRVLVLNSEIDLAQPLARKLLAIAPQDADILYLNGVLDRTGGDFPTAEKHLHKAVMLNPNHYNSRYNYGVVLDQLNRPAEAKDQLQKAIELGANEPEIRFALAKVLRKLGETDAAQEQLKLYQIALKGKSDRTLAAQKSTQAAQALASGDKQRAADLYKEACTATPDNAGLAYQLAMVLNDLGDMQGERAALDQAIKSDPDFAQAQYQLGYVESRAGNAAAAEKQFRLAVKAAPGYVQAWVALSASVAMQSRFREAQEAVETALKLDPGDDDALQLKKSLAQGSNQH